MSDQPLQRAIELVQSEKIEEARELLALILKEERSNISAWQWYAVTWPEPKDKIRVWELCLRHNPMNQQATQAFTLLKLEQIKRKNSQLARESKSLPASGTSSRFSKYLLWGSIGLFLIVAVLTIIVVRIISPEDPAKYRHTKPVEYYLYAPKEYSADQEWPLFVGIHGAGGTGLDCWNLWQSFADQEGFILLCPSIPGDARGFYQDVGESTVLSAIGEVKKEYNVKPRMFFSGFSAGAYFIQGFMVHYPQYVSGLSILSAGVYVYPDQFAEFVPMLVVIGGRDDRFALKTSVIFAAELQKIGFDVKYVLLPEAGHLVSQEGIDLSIELFRKTIGK